ncbi:MAG: hypothetical protein L6R38_008476, partial [Xanthoria sp. 2 TBL-2021]
MLCNANALEYCGGPNRLNMYQVDTSNAKVLLDSTTFTTSPSSTTSSSSTTASTTTTSSSIGSSTTTPSSIGSSSTTSSSTGSSTTTPSSAGSSTTTSSSTGSSTTSTSSTITTTSSPSSTSTLKTSTSTSPTSTTPTSSSTATTSSSTSSSTTSRATTTTTTTTSSSSTSKTSTTSTTTSSATYSPTPGSLLNKFSYLGCANETNPRALSSASFSTTSMTLSSCLSFCASSSNNYALAALENGSECYCGNGLQSYSAVGFTGCNKPCSGNKTEICGGSSRLSVWNYTEYIPPTTVRQVGTYLSQGCFPEASNGRLLSSSSYTNKTGMTVESCVNFCSGSNSPYAGLEFGQECYCGSSLPTTAQSTDLAKCNMLCKGNNREFCGAQSLLNVYKDTPGSVSAEGVPKTVNA